jgi:excisionase family DNA binding protein
LTTTEFIELLRKDISNDLEQKLLDRLVPLIEQKLSGNVFDFKQATEYLNLSESTLRRMVSDKEVPFFKQRGQFFFRQNDLDRWIDEQVASNYKFVKP